MNSKPEKFQGLFRTRDAFALIALTLLFMAMLIASWQRWTQPLLDHGREMNLPSRVLAGEQLYGDVQFLYGPFAPYFNALLYRIFGVHLSVLKISGAISAILILLLIYWLSRQLMEVWESTVTTALVLVICTLKSTANYIQPYAYAALYGLVFALFSLANIIGILRSRSESRSQPEKIGNPARLSKGEIRKLVLAGLFAGLSLISKPEIALAAFGAAAAALIIESVSIRRWLWSYAVWFALPVLVVASAAYGFILSRVPLHVLLNDNHILFTNMPPQLVYFNRHISGLATWPVSMWFTLSGLGVFVMWTGICATLGALASMRTRSGWPTALKTGAFLLIAGAVWREAAIKRLHVPSDVTPLASAAIMLPAMIGLIGYRIWRLKDSVSFECRALLVTSVFGLLSILRAILNVTTTGPYTPFFIPVLIIVYLYLLFQQAPALLVKDVSIRSNVQRVAVCLAGAMVIGMAINSA